MRWYMSIQGMQKVKLSSLRVATEKWRGNSSTFQYILNFPVQHLNSSTFQYTSLNHSSLQSMEVARTEWAPFQVRVQ